MKKTLALLLVLVMMLSLMAGCKGEEKTPETDTTTKAAAEGEAIKVGVLSVLTGFGATGGEQGNIAMEVFKRQYGNEVNGVPIEFYVEDTAGDSAVCLEKVKKLVEDYGCSIILGPVTGTEAVAVKEYAKDFPEVTFLIDRGAAENVTMRGNYPNVFHTTYTGAQVTFPLGEFAVKELGYKRILIIGSENDFTYSTVSGLVISVTEAGGEIVDRLWLSLTGATDYSSLIAQINKDEIDAIYLAVGSAVTVDLLQQLKDYGFEDFPIFCNATCADTDVLINDSAVILEGVYSGSHVTQTMPYESYNEFVKLYREVCGDPERWPGIFSVDPYVGLEVMHASLVKLYNDGKNIKDNYLDYQQYLRETDMMTVRGPFKFDETQGVVFTSYLNRVERDENGNLYNVAVGTFEEQSRYGAYDPEWYESLPSPDAVHPTTEEAKTVKRAG